MDAQKNRMADTLMEQDKVIADAQSEIARLTKERDEARAETAAAYEKAARVADKQPIANSIATKIRALATEADTTALAEIVTRVREEAFRDGHDRGFGDACLSPGAAPPLSTRVSAYIARIDRRKEAGE